MSFDLGHFGPSAFRVDDAYPLTDEIEQHGSLSRRESGCAHTLRLNHLAVVTGSCDDVLHFVIQSRLLLLGRAQGIHQSKSFVVLMTQRPDRLAIKGVHGGLRAGVARSEDVLRAGDGDVDRQMMSAELDHPWFARGRFAQYRNVILGSSKPGSSRRWTSRRSCSLQCFIAVDDVDHLLVSGGAQGRSNDG